MTLAGALGGALLLLAAPEAAASPTDAAPVAEPRFAPPLDRPLSYRVTTRRLGRSGALIEFALVYTLEWQRAGRGYRLDATLLRIESDARPELVQALTGLLQPIVGEPVAYLVDAEGRGVTLADPQALWTRVARRTHDLAASAASPEARQVADLLAALPEAERDKAIGADIRALIAPADAAAEPGEQVGGHRTIARVDHAELRPGTPLRIDMLWTIDAASGLVLREQRQSWVTEPGTEARTLVEERIRALDIAAPY
ncbi:MAG TPA: hypothetical protein PKD99_09645 [Sphingopyxis sp.]|nr:hypothetical protein [Sphingopyxis sp.]HMP45356.1 hypothetical protein [Sphingopyxis sp.]HMQ19210.1 hypothetical protein [Sphingopyxis sp.]